MAYKTLLRGRSAYGAGDRPLNVARFEDGLVSLPTSVADAPLLKQVLPGPAAEVLGPFRTRMLRSQKHCEALDEVLGAPNSFFDEILKSNELLYAVSVKRCVSIGMLAYTTECEEQLSPFFRQKEEQISSNDFELPKIESSSLGSTICGPSLPGSFFQD